MLDQDLPAIDFAKSVIAACDAKESFTAKDLDLIIKRLAFKGIRIHPRKKRTEVYIHIRVEHMKYTNTGEDIDLVLAKTIREAAMLRLTIWGFATLGGDLL